MSCRRFYLSRMSLFRGFLQSNWLERYLIGVIRPIYNGGKRAYSKA